MAIVSVQLHVSKLAGNGDYANRVIQGWETFSINVKGETVTKKRLWTIWLDKPCDLVKGDVVEFHGELGVKAGEPKEYMGKMYTPVECSMNEVRYNVIKKMDPSQIVVETPIVPGESPF